MRSHQPFFVDVPTSGSIEAAANAAGCLLLYCGAGVTIDRTGHSWASLIRSLLPERRHKTRPYMPARGEVERLRRDSPEGLASSVVGLLRQTRGGGEGLQRTLRDRLRKSLYQTQSQWQQGYLVEEIITLAVVRSAMGRDTKILTTNYDTFLEQSVDELLAVRPDHLPAPGLRVYAGGSGTPVRTLLPKNMDEHAGGAYIDVVYLHGRLPDAGSGTATWPLVLDERSYASTAAAVEATIEAELRDASFALMLGTSLQDTPLVRALSVTAATGCDRFAMLLRADFAYADGTDEELALELARHRATELRVTTLFPDFPHQVAQLIREVTLRMVYPVVEPHRPDTFPYIQRLEHWWHEWTRANAADQDLNLRLQEMVTYAYSVVGVDPPPTPAAPATERLQVELWVREAPVTVLRSLRRWGTSNAVHPDGMSGKSAPIERESYLAPVRAFVEGRPLLLDVEDLDGGRHDVSQYTWKSFLAVPIRVNSAMVGVISIASDKPLAESSLNKSISVTTELVSGLRYSGAAVLKV